MTPSYKAAQEKVNRLTERVNELEALLDVDVRWSEGHPDYERTKTYAYERRYRLALDHLEKLVVQRMFELEKTNLVSTCKHHIMRVLLRS